jgi:hypothetical protein
MQKFALVTKRWLVKNVFPTSNMRSSYPFPVFSSAQIISPCWWKTRLTSICHCEPSSAVESD